MHRLGVAVGASVLDRALSVFLTLSDLSKEDADLLLIRSKMPIFSQFLPMFQMICPQIHDRAGELRWHFERMCKF
jgi:hypothetical protein